MNDLLEALWLFLPAGLANIAPVIGNKIPVLNAWKTPLDFGRSYNGQRIFGDNKTWRGVVSALFVGGLAGVLQSLAPFHSFDAFSSFMIGSLLGFGAIYGDAIESFFKRQYGVPAGRSWFPFDQIDYIIGGLLAVTPLAIFNWGEMAAIAIVYFGLHLVGARLGFRLKLKDQPI